MKRSENSKKQKHMEHSKEYIDSEYMISEKKLHHAVSHC